MLDGALEAGEAAHETLFDYLDDAELLVEEGAVRRGMDVLSALEQAEGTGVLLSEKEGSRGRPVPVTDYRVCQLFR